MFKCHVTLLCCVCASYTISVKGDVVKAMALELCRNNASFFTKHIEEGMLYTDKNIHTLVIKPAIIDFYKFNSYSSIEIDAKYLLNALVRYDPIEDNKYLAGSKVGYRFKWGSMALPFNIDSLKSVEASPTSNYTPSTSSYKTPISDHSDILSPSTSTSLSNQSSTTSSKFDIADFSTWSKETKISVAFSIFAFLVILYANRNAMYYGTLPVANPSVVNNIVVGNK